MLTTPLCLGFGIRCLDTLLATKEQLLLSQLRVYNHGRGLTRSLKLTEITIDDFAARCATIRKMATPRARIFYKEPAARRRSLAPIR